MPTEETTEVLPTEDVTDPIDDFPGDEPVPNPLVDEEPAPPPAEDNPYDFEDPGAPGATEEPKDEEESEETQEDVAAETPEMSKIDKLRAIAERVGMDAAEVEDWAKSPDLFEQYLATFDAGDTPDDPGEVVRGADDDEEAFEVELDPDLYEPALIDEFNRMQDHFQQKLDARSTEIDRLLDALERREARDSEAEFDGFVDTLTKDWKSVLGDGPSTALKPGPELDARRAVQEQMKTVAAGYEARGMEVPSDRELFDQAVKTALADEATKIERSKVRKELNRRQRRATVRPTDRDTRKTSDPGIDKATATAAAFMEERGMLEPQYKGFLNGA